MIRREDGFTLVELMVTMVIFVMVIAAASQIFTGLLAQFKQQSRISETNIEGVIGLDMFRRDIERAGFGLPWIFPTSCTITYAEATGLLAATFNDAPSGSPRAVVIGNDMNYSGSNDIFDHSDYLVIKASNVATSDASQAWSRITMDKSGTVTKMNGLSGESFDNNDRIVAVSLQTTVAGTRALVCDSTDSTVWTTTFGDTANFQPTENGVNHVLYGIKPKDDDSSWPRMPFNRADYYISKPLTNMPKRCAPNTGILYKSVIINKEDTGGGRTSLPILDCVADMQVVLGLDMNSTPNGTTDTYTDGDTWSSAPFESVATTTGDVQAALADAAALRGRLREVRVYILAHEGQRDPGYTHTATASDQAACGGDSTKKYIYVGDKSIGMGHCYEIANNAQSYLNYRWKVYSVVVQPGNLR